MATTEKNYSICEVGTFADLADKEINDMKGRVMLGGQLGLTGCEVSINSVKAGKSSPFLHAHKLNEELYMIMRGKGMFHVDGEEFPIREGSMIRVAPQGVRAIKADEDLLYICIQANKGSLVQATMEDGVLSENKASWMK